MENEESADVPLLVLPFLEWSPVLIEIGPFSVRWYALAYICGILSGWLYDRASLEHTSGIAKTLSGVKSPA